MASILAAPPAQPALPLIGLGAAIGALELVCGFAYPAMALNLEARGASLALIGCQAAMVGVGLTLSAPGAVAQRPPGRAPPRSRQSRAGQPRGARLRAVEGVGWWFALAPLLGVTINIWYLQSETWINQLAQDHSRGRTVGLVGGLRVGAGACGPLLIRCWASPAPPLMR